MNLSFGSILVEGLFLSLGLSVVILVSLSINPRIWLQDYPPEIKARVAPQTPLEKQQRAIVAVCFLAVAVGVLFVSTMRLHAENGGSPSFLAIFLNSYAVLQVFNLFDVVVLDYLLLTVIRPTFATIPGSEAVIESISLSSVLRFHFVGFLQGCIYLAVVSLIVAALISVF